MKRKYAVPVDQNGILDAHFGHCKYFALHEVEKNEITTTEMVQPPPHEPGLLPRWLADLGVTDVLAGGMGNRAVQLFNQQGVNVFVGAPQLKAEELVNGYLGNSIEFSANYCDH
jgi:predicted Fe-Mo cluster-binding NifX family protein